MMDLVRKANITYSQVNRNILILEKEEIVEIRYYGRMRMIRLNRENERTKRLLKALAILRQNHEISLPNHSENNNT